MEMNLIEVQTQALKSDKDFLNTELTHIRREANSLYNEISELNSMWKGSASIAYKNRFQAEYEDIEGLLNEMELFIKNLEFAVEQYNRCEDEVADIIRAIQV